jgi:hypothetical protein
MKKLCIIIAFLVFICSLAFSDDLQERKLKIQSMDEGTISKEAISRKANSIKRLKKEKVPFIEHLPVIEDSTEAKKRTKEEICYRAVALCIVAVKGEGLEQDVIKSLVSKYNIAPKFSPKEKSFINNPVPSQHDKIQFAWRYECYWVFLWALGYIDDLSRPDSICNVQKAVSILANREIDTFIKDAELRNIHEILDQADLIYRYHWAVVDARINGKKAPAGLDSGVVMERHHALNWLIGYMDQSWDNISTDT